MTDSQDTADPDDTAVVSRAVELAVGLLLFGIGVYAFAATFTFPPPLSDRDPGPAAFPRYLGLLTMILGAGAVVRTLRRKDEWVLPRPSRSMAIFGWFTACVLLEPVIGYLWIMPVFVFGVLTILNVRRWYVTVPFSVLVALGTYAIFGNILGIPL